MHKASLENCKKLYELSGWDDLLSDGNTYSDIPRWGVSKVPQYPLSYLLRKLPFGSITLGTYKGSWYAQYSHETKFKTTDKAKSNIEYADTPEDATCLLTIKLIEEKILEPK